MHSLFITVRGPALASPEVSRTAGSGPVVYQECDEQLGRYAAHLLLI